MRPVALVLAVGVTCGALGGFVVFPLAHWTAVPMLIASGPVGGATMWWGTRRWG